MDILQQEIIVQDQPKIKTLFLIKLIPFFLGLGCFFLAWLLCGCFDWFVPFDYVKSDFFYHMSLMKRLMDGVWYYNTSYTGFPFGDNILDFPASDAGNFAVLKILAVLTRNLALVNNLYILSGYSVISIASYWVAQKLQLTRISSLAVAILFAFLPFHFMRIDHHFLAWYFTVPLYTWFAFEIFSKQPLFFQSNKGYVQVIARVLSLLILSCFGVYYAFFAVLSFIGSGIIGSLKWRSRQNIFSAFIAVAIVFIGVGLNIAPSINFWLKNGRDPEVAERYPFEAELYGLKMTQMLLPHRNHRSIRLANVVKKYEKIPVFINENASASLGAIGTIGFLTLLAIFLFNPFLKFQIDNRVQLLAFLTIFLFLYATVGGFSSIFNTLISPMIRSVNRMSVFIDFFVIVGFFILFEMLLKKISNPKYLTGNLIVITFLLCVFGVWEQSMPNDKVALKLVQQQFFSDKHFIEKIEAIIPNGAVYQLPYMGFPEVPTVNDLIAYALFRGYLHSTSLRWSYGGMKGRKGDLFFRNLSVQPLANQIKAIKPLGFNGIYIDRRGYADRGKSVEAELKKILSVNPLVSEDENLVFFPWRARKIDF